MASCNEEWGLEEEAWEEAEEWVGAAAGGEAVAWEAVATFSATLVTSTLRRLLEVRLMATLTNSLGWAI